ncbi:hypothetical protein MPSEU_000881700 [Mayamaea pseudoterrestris]|nr:hypothetical protein MPSEU_000881700 [Mayamaea pseudoterrestris]
MAAAETVLTAAVSDDENTPAAAGAAAPTMIPNTAQQQDSFPMLPSLIIPIQNSELFIEIFPEELAETNVATLLKVLDDEHANMETYCSASLLYMQQPQRTRESLALMEEACHRLTLPECDGMDNATRARILSAAGIAQLATSTRSKSGSTSHTSSSSSLATTGANHHSDQVRQDADQKFTHAAKLDTFCSMTWVGRGMLQLSVSRLDQAKFYWETTLQQAINCLPALLGMAAVQYGQGQYQLAQDSYAKAIQQAAASSANGAVLGLAAQASLRVGFGLASYQLGQVDRARAAFARALAMDSECVSAMVGIAVLDMGATDHALVGGDATTSTADFGRTEQAIKLMSMANLLDQTNAMVQNHLANHYFYKWSALPGTVRVERGSNVLYASQSLPGLEIGDRVRVGAHFETSITEDSSTMFEFGNSANSNSAVFRMQDMWKSESMDELDLVKKDYDRVIALAKGAYGSTSVPEMQAESLFFLARVYHVREENDTALKFYERACKLNPSLAPARFGLAQTLVVKGDYTQAKNHLHKLLATSGNATDSLLLLGLLEVKAGGKSVEGGLANISKAVELDPFNADLLLLEALALRQHRSTYLKAADKLEKAIDLMKRKGDAVPYEVYANRGVLCEGLNRHEEALEMFTLALHALDPSGRSCQFALDNLGTAPFIRQDANAMFCGYVDSTVKVRPTIVKVVANQANEDESESHEQIDEDANYVTVLKVVDPGSLEDFAALSVQVGDSVKVGDNFISTVVKVEAAEGSDVSITVKDDMKTTVDDAAALFVKRENRILNLPEATTVAFNIARLHETMGRTLAAIEIHKALLKRNPAYFPSALRLACISVDCGSLMEGAQWLKISAAIEKTPEVLTLIGNLHLSLCDWAAAQPIFDDLLAKKVPNVDAYSMLSLGTIYFSTLFVNPERYSKHLTYASDYFKSVLGKDPANAYAANGLGAVLAEKGEIYKAKEIFNRVREVSGDTIADALMNLGHILLATKKHPEALQMYQSYMKRAESIGTPVTSKSRKDDVVDVLLYIAFAFFDWARQTELSADQNAAPADERYRSAMEHLELAIAKQTKREVVLKYDLAMTKLSAANCILQRPSRGLPRTADEVQEALVWLRESLGVVTQILEEKAEKKIPISSSVLESFIGHCENNIRSAESHLENDRLRAAEEANERALRRAIAEAEMKEEQYKEALAREKELEEQAERDRRADAAMAKVSALRENWHQEQAQAEQAKEKKSKKKSGSNVDADALGLVEDDGQTGRGLFDDSSDDDSVPEAEQGGAKSQAPDLFGDSSDDDGEEKMEDSSDKQDKATSSRGIFDDSSDDESTNKNILNAGGDTSVKPPLASDLFGDSSDEESDEELITESDAAKRKNESANVGQPIKKQRVMDEGDDSSD